MSQGQLFETLQLFEVTELPAPAGAEPCPMCRLNPQRWSHRAQQFQRYCGGRSCVSALRLCHHCDKPFNVSEGRNKYCSLTCMQDANTPAARAVREPCELCHAGTYLPGSRYPVCLSCRKRYALGALARHGVPWHRVRAHLANPICDNPGCGALLDRSTVKVDGSRRTVRQVDHDHRHCPGQLGCEECFRGFLCYRCNAALGALDDDPTRLRGLLGYVERFA